MMRLAYIVAGILFLTSLSQGQQATISYTQDFPGSDPSHYVISITSDGHGRYEGNGRLTTPSKYSTDDSVPDTEQLDFIASKATVDKVFDLGKRANYFRGEVESKKRNLAFTGKKTLTYTDGEHKTSTTYNFPSVPEVGELTHTFQNLSSTLEFGRRLEYCHKHQKLALDQESKQMESAAQSGGLEDVSAIGPILQKIIADRSVINVVRARLQRLLDSK